MALSKSVNYFVNTIYYDTIAIGALNTNDSEAIQSTLPHRAAKMSSVSEVRWRSVPLNMMLLELRPE